MRKAKVVSAIAIPVFFIVGILAASVYAKGRPPKPEPILDYVQVTGEIEGKHSSPKHISIEFFAGSFGEHAGSFVANPDYPPALEVGGPGKNRTLTYFYCDHEIHNGETNTMCAEPDTHGFDHYKELMISGGKVTSKGGENLKIVFPAGSAWRIGSKKTMAWDYAGILADPVTYTEVYE